MRKFERGEGGFEVLVFLVLMAGILFLGYKGCRSGEREVVAPCLKEYLNLEHSKYSDFSADEAIALAPAVQTKRDELWNAKVGAYDALQHAGLIDRAQRLDAYQKARDAFQCFDDAVHRFGLWPPPKPSPAP